MAKQALILIDIQNDYFPQGKWPLDGVEAAADKAAQALQAFRQAGDAVIHVRHEFTSEDANALTQRAQNRTKIRLDLHEPSPLRVVNTHASVVSTDGFLAFTAKSVHVNGATP